VDIWDAIAGVRLATFFYRFDSPLSISQSDVFTFTARGDRLLAMRAAGGVVVWEGPFAPPAPHGNTRQATDMNDLGNSSEKELATRKMSRRQPPFLKEVWIGIPPKRLLDVQLAPESGTDGTTAERGDNSQL